MNAAKTLLLSTLTTLSLSAAAGPRAVVDVTLSPAGSFKATSNRVTGVAYKTANGVVAENVAIDLSNLSTGVGLRDKHTKEHLEVAKYPQAKLIKAVGHDGKGEAMIEIKGVKQKVAGTYEVEGNVLKAQFPVELSKLDIKNVRYMGIGVKDTVVVHVDLPISAGAPPTRAMASAAPATAAPAGAAAPGAAAKPGATPLPKPTPAPPPLPPKKK